MKSLLEERTLTERFVALPFLRQPPSDESFTKISTAAQLHYVTCIGNCFDQRFEKRLGVEPDVSIAAWRQRIVMVRGVEIGGAR
jgi:hypothetical protein